MTDQYDPAENSRRCYELAIAELRKRGLLEGRFEPKDDAERALLREGV